MRGFYKAIKRPRYFDGDRIATLLGQVSEDRVTALAGDLAAYMATFLPVAIRSKSGLGDYRTNPYVLMTTASTMKLEDHRDLANFLVNLKLYMGLETSFGKSLESTILGLYPVDRPAGVDPWHESPEKVAELAALEGMSDEEKAAARSGSIWREIDKSCVAGNRRHLVSIKSGPNTINDTQVDAMKTAVLDHHAEWLEKSAESFPIEGIDIVIGLTYGTEKSTNNKENQILVKLMGNGFEELDRERHPGILVNADHTIRVYRVVGADFWSYIGSPSDPSKTSFVFLEILLALAKALQQNRSHKDIESALNERLDMLAAAIRGLRFPRDSLPGWVKDEFSVSELSWLAAALSVFHDA